MHATTGCRHRNAGRLILSPGTINSKSLVLQDEAFFMPPPSISRARLRNFAHGLVTGMRLRRICIFIHYSPSHGSAFFVIRK